MALRGDLADASPAELLTSLSDSHASGALAIDRAGRSHGEVAAGDFTATLHLRNGLVYAAALAGGTFLVGTRLVTSHALDADALAEALEAQRTDLSGWRLGEILVHLGHIHTDVVEKISIEQVLEIATEVLSWREGSWKFRSGERTRAMLPHPMTVEDLLRRVQARGAEWRELLPIVGGRHAPVLRTPATVPLSSSRELMALLRATDEHPDGTGLEVCAHAAGVSLLEGARLVVSARSAGLLTAPPMEAQIAVGDWPREQPPSTVAPPANLTLAPALPEPASELSSYALARLLELTGPVRETTVDTVTEPVAVTVPPVEAAVAPPVEATAVKAAEQEAAAQEAAAAIDAPAVDAPSAQAAASEAAAVEAGLTEPTPEEIVADLEPETFEDNGHEATVLDLNAARAARSAELATLEEAATSMALREQLAREQADRDADERAVSDALRLAVQSRVATVPRAAEAVEPVVQPGSSGNDMSPPQVTEVVPGVVVEEPTAEDAVDKVTAEDAVHKVTAEAVAAEAAHAAPAFTRPAAFSTAPFAAPAPAAFTTSGPPPTPLTAGERLGMFSTSRDPLADTASLLRELSSLGDEDGDPAENRPLNSAEISRHASAVQKGPEKKRKSLFGR